MKHYTTKLFRYLHFLFIILIILESDRIYCQKTSKQITHSETVKTDNGYAKINMLDQQKKKIKTRENLEYFWHLNDAIHTSIGGYGGKLLHGNYTAYYATNNIKEQGNFRYGLKSGSWKKWYTNGIINSVTLYKHGMKCGIYREYDEKGLLTLSAKYCNDKLQGKYLEYKDGKLISEKHYKKGVEKTQKVSKLKNPIEKAIKKPKEKVLKKPKAKKEKSNVKEKG